MIESSNRQSRQVQELIVRICGKTVKDSVYRTTIESLNQKSNDDDHQLTPISLIEQSISTYLRSTSNHHSPQSAQTATNLITRLIPLTHPREKFGALKFLYALANPTPTNQLPDSLPHIHSPLHHQDEPINDPQPPTLSTANGKTSLVEKLRCRRSQHHYPTHLSESLLLRDIIYILQGIHGKFIRFSERTKENRIEVESWEESGMTFLEPIGSIITLPQRDLILKLSELGYLYKRIELTCNEQLKGGGMVAQAFVYALKEELGIYYRVIACIESKLTSKQLTLKSLLLHLNPTLLRLRISSTLLASTQNLIGGKLVNVLDSYTNHGDPLIYQFISNLLEKVLVPWFKTLANWIWDGELLDPNQEFFITLNNDQEEQNWNHDQKSNLGWKIWESKFKFRQDMVPSFINPGFARKIYSTGKSINFIKYSCSETDWQQTRTSLSKISEKVTLHYSDTTGLEMNISSAYAIGSKQLFTIFFHKLKLLDHLKALKDYLLLGRGDFISLLIESLGPSLNKPASSLYRHNLTSTLESAIKLTSTNQMTDLIDRLDVRMLEFESTDLGWDVFMLEYKTEAPLDVILGSKAMEKYMKMFRMIWRIKRVEYVLDLGWKVLMVGCRSRGIDDQLKNDFHKSRIVVSEMVHFIRQLCSFVQLEVIECGWQSFQSTVMVDGGDLDSLVEAHRVYLDRLVSKGMLLNPKKVGKENACLLLAEDCFRVILSYKASIDSLHAYALSDTQSVGQLDDIRRRMSSQAKNFTDLVLDLISALTAQPDPDLRFLSVRLNFSLFYLRPKASGGAPSRSQQSRK